MTIAEWILVASTVIMPILSGIGSYIFSTKQTKKDIERLREQNKLEIDKLMNQHKLDLESLERKHQMEIEKMEIDHKHALELKQKEMEGKLGTDLFTGMLNGVMSSPEIKSQMSQAVLQSMNKNKRKR
jgi:hypothetical protein